MRDLARYTAFERVHGPLWVGDRLDVAIASITWAILAALTDTKAKPEDFLPVWDEAKREQSDEDIIAKLRSIQAKQKEMQ